VISVDLVTDTNAILKELCFADIDLAMQRGAHFVLISDGLSFSSIERSHTDAVLLHNHGNISLVYSAADVPQMVLHKDEIFNTLVGGQVNLILFRHINSNSAKKWSDFFGQEWVQLIETNECKNSQDWKLFSSGTTKGISTRTERADKFPPETFTDMPAGQGKAYLLDSDGLINQLASDDSENINIKTRWQENHGFYPAVQVKKGYKSATMYVEIPFRSKPVKDYSILSGITTDEIEITYQYGKKGKAETVPHESLVFKKDTIRIPVELELSTPAGPCIITLRFRYRPNLNQFEVFMRNHNAEQLNNVDLVPHKTHYLLELFGTRQDDLELEHNHVVQVAQCQIFVEGVTVNG